MKVCSKCNIEKDNSEFKTKKHKKCKTGMYISGICNECERAYARTRDKLRRLNGDEEYIQKRRNAVKKYQKTDKGKKTKKKNDAAHKAKRREYYLANCKKNYQQRLARLKNDIENISDEYVITNAQNPHRKVKYSREFLKQNPDIIEQLRVQILNHRLKRKIEEVSEFGFCTRCGSKVLKSEFRKQRTTDKKREHIIRLCIKCRKENSIKCWQKYKSKKHERHSKPS